ncbi:uncharacterized protein MYCFIDRAFT_194512 [Pseudocercospora fijiensis CIRAD86]|uniref:Uncharacterized protein n=1 Tax=Pseudocercospora fijiensis (strain CIRAD86) TaxID=383855 RepID=M3A5P9_PSEFD|nr:uncharacterized protein MYCFIDRAFT_194512 [Pseudocercospora fijiensis CIRAD86]EME86454.1 hypothetical protein MYCFIDRAFT_194512 [Pseudocercospora fijiensis CIRAD86]
MNRADISAEAVQAPVPEVMVRMRVDWQNVDRDHYSGNMTAKIPLDASTQELLIAVQNECRSYRQRHSDEPWSELVMEATVELGDDRDTYINYRTDTGKLRFENMRDLFPDDGVTTLDVEIAIKPQREAHQNLLTAEGELPICKHHRIATEPRFPASAISQHSQMVETYLIAFPRSALYPNEYSMRLISYREINGILIGSCEADRSVREALGDLFDPNTRQLWLDTESFKEPYRTSFTTGVPKNLDDRLKEYIATARHEPGEEDDIPVLPSMTFQHFTPKTKLGNLQIEKIHLAVRFVSRFEAPELEAIVLPSDVLANIPLELDSGKSVRGILVEVLVVKTRETRLAYPKAVLFDDVPESWHLDLFPSILQEDERDIYVNYRDAFGLFRFELVRDMLRKTPNGHFIDILVDILIVPENAAPQARKEGAFTADGETRDCKHRIAVEKRETGNGESQHKPMVRSLIAVSSLVVDLESLELIRFCEIYQRDNVNNDLVGSCDGENEYTIDEILDNQKRPEWLKVTNFERKYQFAYHKRDRKALICQILLDMVLKRQLFNECDDVPDVPFMTFQPFKPKPGVESLEVSDIHIAVRFVNKLSLLELDSLKLPMDVLAIIPAKDDSAQAVCDLLLSKLEETALTRPLFLPKVRVAWCLELWVLPQGASPFPPFEKLHRFRDEQESEGGQMNRKKGKKSPKHGLKMYLDPDKARKGDRRLFVEAHFVCRDSEGDSMTA